jgi:outer membrane protein OmpA-like peptidoglycan-associated protein
MQITGHAADYPTKATQASVSKGRAAKIYNELKKAGVPAAKMTYKGVGIDEPLSGYDGKDAKQRRVSFKAVKK